ncbi:hypothetical protein U1Q18_002866 [Sarracenia purpurea var. burkii]
MKHDPSKENNKHGEDTCEEVGESTDGGRSVSQGRRLGPAMAPSPENVSGKSSRRQSLIKQAVTISRIIGEISGEKDLGDFQKF